MYKRYLFGLFILLFILFFLGFKYVDDHFLIDRFLYKQNPPQLSNISPPFDKTIVFLGDSMTEYLGNFEFLHYYLKKEFPTKKILLLNYGYSATNLLNLNDRIATESSHSGRTFQAVKDIPYDYIFIESFGHNPLSQFPLAEGLKKQNEILDQTINTLTQNHPKSTIVFIATIAPNEENYALNQVDLSPDKRIEWAKEREAYIENHINYAKTHGIPLVNVYDKSHGNLLYINKTDYIHPSLEGLYLISREIANYLKTILN